MDRNVQFGLALTAGLGTSLALATRWRNRMDFKNASVVITGGSRGLGLAMARHFADEGARLTLLARDQEELDRAARDLAERGADVLTIACDVRDQDAVQTAIDRVAAERGRIDVLINNAGVIQVGPLEHMKVEDFRNAIDTHTMGPLYSMLATIPHMRRGGGGRIANISSIGGKVAVPHLMPYSTSKFALVGLSDGMRAELAKDKIKVTTVCPGLMRTGSHVNALFKGKHEDEFTWFSVFDALPGFSMGAERAAGQIVQSIRYGDPQCIVTIQAQLAIAANTLLPGLTARLMALFAELLPAPTDKEGDQLKTGWESQSPLAPSVLTRLADQATTDLNGLQGHEPLAE